MLLFLRGLREIVLCFFLKLYLIIGKNKCFNVFLNLITTYITLAKSVLIVLNDSILFDKMGFTYFNWFLSVNGFLLSN